MVADCAEAPGKVAPSPRGRGLPKCLHRRYYVASTSVRTSSKTNKELRLLRKLFQSLFGTMALRIDKWGTPSLNHSRLCFSKLMAWVGTTSSGSGVGFLINYLKVAAQQARLRSISGDPAGPHLKGLLRRLPSVFRSRKGLEQLSFIARGLPAGNDEVVRRALEKHKEAVKRPFTTNPTILAAARSFGLMIGQRLLKGDPSVTTLPYSSGAVIERSRSKGGFREALRTSGNVIVDPVDKPLPRWAERHPDVQDPLNYASIGEFPMEDWCGPPVIPTVDPVPLKTYRWREIDAMVGPPAVYAEAARRFSTRGGLPLNRVCAVRERGFKARIVSAPELDASTVGTALNRKLLDALRTVGTCKLFLEGNRRGAIARAYRPRGLIISTDLSAASDMLPLDLVKSIVDGLKEGWADLPPEWGECLSRLTGPQRLVYPDGEELVSERGILMGLGPTWPILSLVQIFWVRKALFAAPKRDRRDLRTATGIGGDDLIGFWPERMVNAYSNMVRRCGGVFSPGKHFTSYDAGNFTEITFYRTPVHQPTLKFGLGLPMKGFVGRHPLLVGAAYEALGEIPGLQVRARRLLRVAYPDAWSRVRTTGLNPTLPSPLGGAGLPPRKGSLARITASLRMLLALGRFLYGTPSSVHISGPPGNVECADAVLIRAFRQAILTFESWLTRRRLAFSPTGPVTVADQLSSLLVFYCQRSLYDGRELKPVSPEPVPARTRARFIRAWVKRQLVGGVPKSLALRNRANSRYALLTRLAILRRQLKVDYARWP